MSDSGPPETAAAKRALRDAIDRTASDDHRRVVAAAETATDDVRAAAAFVDAVGLDRLDRAVRALEERGADDVAAEGRAARDAFRRFRRAARSSPDHFHSARGTPLGGDGQGRDR